MIGAIGLSRQERLIRRLVDLLDKEKDLLVRGDLDKIANLRRALETTTDQLAAIPDPPVMALEGLLKDVAGRAQRNCELARAGQRGLEAAGRLFAQVRDAGNGLTTYTVSGTRADIATAPARKDRRT